MIIFYWLYWLFWYLYITYIDLNNVYKINKISKVERVKNKDLKEYNILKININDLYIYYTIIKSNIFYCKLYIFQIFLYKLRNYFLF